jgi:hypothetical protein
MPWVFPSEIARAIIFLGRQSEVDIPPTIQDHARKAGLASYLDETERPGEFWAAAELDDANWRKVYMGKRPKADYLTADKATITKIISALETLYVDLTDEQQTDDVDLSDSVQAIESPFGYPRGSEETIQPETGSVSFRFILIPEASSTSALDSHFFSD